MSGRKLAKTVTLVGAGNLAHALAELLPRGGYKIAEIVTRSNSPRAKALGRKVGATTAAIAHARWSGDVVWLAVSDSAIRELASEVAQVAKWNGKTVLHSSGALSSGDLLPFRRRGAQIASAHPMMTFVPGETPEMAGVVWTLEGDPVAVGIARQIVGALSGRAVKIDPKHKPLYHAFGAFLSPLLVVHLATAADLALKAGVPRGDLGALMKPIVQRTLANLFMNVHRAKGAGKAFSGPLIRGDDDTIRKHLQSLRKFPRALNLYAALVQSAVDSDLPVKNRRVIADLIRNMTR